VTEGEPKNLFLKYTMNVVQGRAVDDVRRDKRIVRGARMTEPADGANIEPGNVPLTANAHAVE
jgi:hypothetical protein